MNGDIKKNGVENGPDDLSENSSAFESDTQKIIHRHLEDENDIISDEDIRNVRIGMVPPVTTDTIKNKEDQDLEDKPANDDEVSEKPMTPWDILDNK